MRYSKRVLLIEDELDYSRLITASLAGSEDLFEVQTAATLAEALNSVERWKPEVILVDLNLPDSSGYQTFLQVRAKAGQIPIVILTGFDDDHTALRAADDGAQDYLIKNLMQPKLIARYINMALSRQARLVASSGTQPVRRLLGFIGSKGGVGTSTTAINVAAHFCASGRDVLAIEFHQGIGTFPFYLPVKPTHGLESLLNVRAASINPQEVRRCLVEAVPGLRLLCRESGGRTVGPEHARAILLAAQQLCPYVIVDLPPYIDEGVAEVLKLCSTTTLFVDREPAAVRCGVEMLEQLRAAVPSSDLRVAIVERTNTEPAMAFEDIKNQLKMRPLVIIPHAASGIAISYLSQTPLVWLERNQSFSLAILELADRLAGPTEALPLDASTLPNLPRVKSMQPLIPEAMYG